MTQLVILLLVRVLKFVTIEKEGANNVEYILVRVLD